MNTFKSKKVWEELKMCHSQAQLVLCNWGLGLTLICSKDIQIIRYMKIILLMLA